MSTIVKKVITTATIAIVAVGIAVPTSSVGAATVDELQAQITALLAQITQLQAQVSAQASSTTTGGGACGFTKSLTVGSSGADVKCLQQYLNGAGYTVSAAGAGSPGSESTYFGAKTQVAVAKWQAANAVSPAVGYFGTISRAKYSSLTASSTPSTPSTPSTTPTTTPVPTTGTFTVSLASDTPVAGTIVDGQGLANLTKFVFSNGTTSAVKVTSIKFKRLGVSADASLTNVYLFQGGQRLTDSATVSSGYMNFNMTAGIFSVPANSAVTISASADIDGTSGETVGIGIEKAADVTSDVTASGTYPLNGNLFTLATASLAGVQFAVDASTTPGTNASLTPQNDLTVWQNAVGITTRSVDFKRIAFRNIGSVAASDLQNFRFYIDGVQVGSTVNLLDANGYVTFDISAAPKRLETGTRTLKLVADVIGGSSKTFRFSVRVAADANFTDTQYGVNVLPTEASSGAFPVQAGQQTIASGSVTITLKTDSPSGNIVNTASAVTYAKYEVKAAGEPVKIESLRVSFTATNSSDGATTDFDTLRNGQLYANNVQIGSTSDINEDSHTTTYTTYNLGSSLIVTPGSPVELLVKADVFDSDGTNSIDAGDKIRVNIEGGDIDNALGTVSGATIDAPSADKNANTLTVRTGSMTLSKYTAFPNTTYVLPLTAKKLGSFTLTAGTTEAVNLNTLTVDYVTDAAADLTSLYVMYGTETAAAKATVSTTTSTTATSSANDFSISKTLDPGQSLTIDVYGNVANTGAETTARVDMQVTGVTANSATTVYGTGTAAATRVVGQTLTYGSGTFTIAKDGGSPLNGIVADNQTVVQSKWKLSASNDSFTLQELFLKLASGSSAAVSSAILKDGNTTLATQTFGTNPDYSSTSQTDSVNFTGLSVAVPGNTSKVLTVEFQLAALSASDGSSGLPLQLTVDQTRFISGTGTDTTDETPGAGGTNPTSNTLYAYASYPTITADNAGLGTFGSMGTTTKLYQWKVKANGGSVGVKQMKFSVGWDDKNTSNLELDTLKLFKDGSDISASVTIRNQNGADVEGASGVSEIGDEAVVDNRIIISWVSGASGTEDIIGSGDEVTYALYGTPRGFDTISTVGTDLVNLSLIGSESATDVRKYLALTTPTGGTASSVYSLAASAGQTSASLNGNGDFIWSDESSIGTVPHTAADDSTGSNDWFTGYLLKNLDLGSVGWQAP